MKNHIVIFLIAIGCMLSFSGSGIAACTDTLCKGKVVRLRLHANILYIGTDGDESQLNCTSPAGSYVSIYTSDPSFVQNYSLLLTAVSLDKTVTLKIKELSKVCSVDYIIMDTP